MGNRRIVFGTVTLNPCIDKTVTVKEFTVSGLNRVISSFQQPAGKGINSSIAFNNLGGNTFCTGINYSLNKSVLEKFLDSKNIKYDFFTVPGELRTNLKIFDLQKNEVTEINERGHKVPDDFEDKFLSKIVELSDGFDVLLLAGSVPQGVNKDIYEKLINSVKKPGLKVILDADGEFFANGIKALPHIIKPNKYELELYIGETLGSDEEIARVSRREFIEKGIEIVCVSIGPEGAVIVDDNSAYRAEGIKVDVKGTVGAGDSMVAGIVYGIDRGYELDGLLRSAVASATASIVKEGTELCDLEGYNKFFPIVDIRPIKI
ncbi:MAG: 1-phosphofructokinase family hexose kinase [Clostridiaceae bacterium]|nr:1-phosphofructokinase family hexose kinase [Clostridiaceae bacterium]